MEQLSEEQMQSAWCRLYRINHRDWKYVAEIFVRDGDGWKRHGTFYSAENPPPEVDLDSLPLWRETA